MLHFISSFEVTCLLCYQVLNDIACIPKSPCEPPEGAGVQSGRGSPPGSISPNSHQLVALNSLILPNFPIKLAHCLNPLFRENRFGYVKRLSIMFKVGFSIFFKVDLVEIAKLSLNDTCLRKACV